MLHNYRMDGGVGVLSQDGKDLGLRGRKRNWTFKPTHVQGNDCKLPKDSCVTGLIRCIFSNPWGVFD